MHLSLNARKLKNKKMNQKILIIKAGYSEIQDKDENPRQASLGDVLRTTPLLHLYKNNYVTWLTDSKAIPLLKDNSYITKLIMYDFITSSQLESEEFDIVINLEKVPDICKLSNKITAGKKFGFRFNEDSKKIEACDKDFYVLTIPEKSYQNLKPEWKNKTLQELLFEIVGEKWNGEEYVLGYKSNSEEKHDVLFNQIEKWPTKKWSVKNWDNLEEKLVQDGLKVTRQDRQNPLILQNIDEYINWINSAKVVVSTDSLGLHLALALKKKVLGLFGPTPYKETYFYGRGKAILPKPIPECFGCFKAKCERERVCMEDIQPEKVYKHIREYI
jgi:heptosyltransferase-2